MYLSTAEAAEALGFNTLMVRRQCKSGLIKMTHLLGPSGRKRYYIHQDDLLKFAKSMKLSDKVIRAIQNHGKDDDDGVQSGTTHGAGDSAGRRDTRGANEGKERKNRA